MSVDPHNVGIEIANILVHAMIFRMKNTPTESSAVYQAGQDKAGAEATLAQPAQPVNPSTTQRNKKSGGDV